MKLTLKEWRRLRGISQAEMAEKVKVSRLTYRGWEECIGKMKVEKLIEILAILEISVSDLELGEG